MDAPKCRICGERHWSRLCAVTRNVTPVVTKPVTVTPAVTDPRDQEIARLRAEVEMLKRMLDTVAPMTGAERMRKLREKKRAQKSPGPDQAN